MSEMTAGMVVVLDCDSYTPKRPTDVVRVDDQGAWLRHHGTDEPTFCLNPSAGHQQLAEVQGGLW